MHELSLAQSILESVLEALNKDQYSKEQSSKDYKNGNFQEKAHQKVATISLSIGKLSCVEPNNLTWYLQEISEGTALEGATIEIDRSQGVMLCNQCKRTFVSNELYCCCPNCNSYDKQIKSGNEMLISHIEVESIQHNTNRNGP